MFKFKEINRLAIVIILAPILLLLLAPHFSLAELVTFQRDYSYQASEADSKLSSRAISLEQVKRLLLEEVGTYLESETEVKNFQLTKDQIVVLTAGIVRTEIIEEKWDGKVYYLKAIIAADPIEVAKSIDRLRKDRQKVKDLEETRKKADELLKEVEKLKTELKAAGAEKKMSKQKEYISATKGLGAIDFYEKGRSLISPAHSFASWRDAIEAFDEAIKLNPKYEMAYLERGAAHYVLKDFAKAIRDFNKVIEMNPISVSAYHNRGNVYKDLGDYDQAVKEFRKVLLIDPQYAWAYFGIANCHAQRGDYLLALGGYKTFIDLEPNVFVGYYHRGLLYKKLGDFSNAIKDLDTVIKLMPNFASAYVNRALAYIELGDYRQAINDFNRAIELEPAAGIYCSRAFAYLKLGEYQRAIEDMKISAKSGFEPAQDFLKSKGIEW